MYDKLALWYGTQPGVTYVARYIEYCRHIPCVL